MEKYNPAKIEKKWQAYWKQSDCFHAEDGGDKPKFYGLIEFPYPSGKGLHVGHPRPYTMMDIVARKRRMEGYHVLLPMGFDAFGLPTENYAVKHHIHPAKVTEVNVDHFRHQLESLGFSFDWDREVVTSDPDYYKWTQWIFIQMYKHGLAYKQEMPVNWCPSCQEARANEEVVDGKCVRCDTPVEQRLRNQWMLRITAYADRLIDDLDEVDYLPQIKQQEINWIGRSYGAEVDFPIKDSSDRLTVFTTRPDTLFGVSYMVMAPEHPYIEKYRERIQNWEAVRAYQIEAAHKSEFERDQLNKEKSGVALEGLKAINPVNGQEIPIWISDYVLLSHGTGAIMAVPGHDSRDWEFARKFGLPIIQVVAGPEGEVDLDEAAYTDIEEGSMINSDFLNGLPVQQAIQRMEEWLEEEGIGHKAKAYKLRDWLFSRQRYWGEPIPMIYCPEHGWVPVPEEELPVLLPNVEEYEPNEEGESPLADIPEFVNTTCPICGGPAKRETDTMPQWAGSSWYYLRYMDPHNDQAPFSEEAENYWGPVDWYNGGMEHTTLHLLYSRFWHKFLYDLGLVHTKEPYAKRTSHGMILGENGEKMSKSRGNVVNTDDIVREYGADTLRTYDMFIGDFQKGASWTENGVMGCRKFLDRVWEMRELVTDEKGYSSDLEIEINQTIKKVSEDYENMKANTAIAQLMTLSNDFRAKGAISRDEMKTFLLLLNPVAPHITEEMWEILGYGGHICQNGVWPAYDKNKLVGDQVEIPVQVNGKHRATISVALGASQEEVEEVLKETASLKKYLEGKKIVKKIYVPNKIMNLVVK